MPKPYHRPCSRAADNCNIFMPQPYSVVHHVGTHTLTRASVHAQAIPTSIMCRGVRQHRHVCASHKLAHFREHTTGAISTPSPGHARLQCRKLPAGARANMPGVWGGGGGGLDVTDVTLVSASLILRSTLVTMNVPHLSRNHKRGT